MRVPAVEDDKFYGQYAEEAFRLFLDKRRKEKSWVAQNHENIIFLLLNDGHSDSHAEFQRFLSS